VIEETATKDRAKFKTALSNAYPFGPRSHYPYKIWCEEVKYALGLNGVTGPIVQGGAIE
jgi:hypothetical protein